MANQNRKQSLNKLQHNIPPPFWETTYSKFVVFTDLKGAIQPKTPIKIESKKVETKIPTQNFTKKNYLDAGCCNYYNPLLNSQIKINSGKFKPIFAPTKAEEIPPKPVLMPVTEAEVFIKQPSQKNITVEAIAKPQVKPETFVKPTTQPDTISKPTQPNIKVSINNIPSNTQPTARPNVSIGFSGIGPNINGAISKDYDTKLIELRKTNQKYIDSEFPANQNSLYGSDNPSDRPHWSKFVWKRPQEFYGSNKFEVFLGGVEPADIKQGELGDCYFLSTLSSLAEIPERITRLIPLPSDFGSTNGLYCVKMCCRGIWKKIYIDDFFPCSKSSGPVFSSGNGNELWVLLLEKAWAKFHKGYLRIEAGLTRECLHDLTGAPTRVLWNDDKNLWESICEGENKNWAMTCGSGGDELGLTQSQFERKGLHPDHAYSLLSAIEISEENGRKVKLVRLRNPWGKGEWQGDWSDKSPKWTSFTKNQLLKKIGQVSFDDRDDGIFHMDFEDFKKYFPDIQICQIQDHYEYSAIESTLDFNHSTVFSLQIHVQGEYFITVNQDSKRVYPRNSNFEYSQATIIIVKNENGNLQYVGGKTGKDREIWIGCKLTQGYYYAWVKVKWFQNNKRPIGLSSYGPKEANLGVFQKHEVKDFLRNCFLSRGRNSRPKWKDHTGKGTYCMSEYSEDGFVYFYFKNENQKKVIFDINFVEMKNLKLAKPFRGNSAKVALNPNEENVVVLKKTGLGINYNYSIKTSF